MPLDPGAIRAIEDPVERIRAVNAALAEAAALTAELAAISREAVGEMRQSMSLREVADALGVSRSRVQQLAGAPKAR